VANAMGLHTNIKLTPNFTALVTAHGKTKAYLHHFKIIESPECPCDGGNQTVDHLIYECNKLQRERERDKLIHNTSNQDKWPVEKSDLVKKHKTFHSICKFHRLRKIMNLQISLLTYRNSNINTSVQ